MRLASILAKNAFANVLRGGASAIVALALPHFLSQSLGRDRFAGWVLMLQVVAYANYLDYGLQTAVARFLARSLECHDDSEIRRLLSTAFALLSAIAFVAFGVLAFLVYELPRLFRSVPVGILPELQIGILVMGTGVCLSLSFSVFTGALIGLQRNELPALAIGGSRLLGAVAVIVASRYTQSLVVLAACIAVFNLLGSLGQFLTLNRLLPNIRFHLRDARRAVATELIRYCSTLTVWSFGMLLVTGLDVTVVGYFSFAAASYYGIAATLIGFFTGLNGAVFSAMMAPIAVLQARKEHSRISQLIHTTTRLNSYASLAVICLVMTIGAFLLRIWVGGDYARLTLPILQVLIVAQGIRMIGTAYSTALVGMGRQSYGLITVLVEGVSNLALSLTLVRFMGPLGVAVGTLIASVIAIATLICVVMHRTSDITPDPARFVYDVILQPCLHFTPLIFWICFAKWSHADPRIVELVGVVMIAGTSVLIGRAVSSTFSSKSKIVDHEYLNR